MPNTRVHTDSAPKAIGPYSQAILHEQLGSSTLWTAGQIPLDPATMELVQGDIAVQTERVMQNLGAVLAAAGMTFADAVKATVFLIDFADFSAMNEIFGKYFVEGAPPARSTVQVAALPRGARVEIDLVAVKQAPPPAGARHGMPSRGVRSGTPAAGSARSAPRKAAAPSRTARKSAGRAAPKKRQQRR